MAESSPAIENLFSEGRTFPHRTTSGPTRWSPTGRCTSRPSRTWRGSGPRRPSGCAGPSRGTRCSSGTCPSPSGSSAGSSTCRTTASTGTSTPAAATRSPTTGRVSRATPGPSPTSSCATTWPGSPTRSSRSGCSGATGSTSTWAWSPSCRWRCSPAPGWGGALGGVRGFSADALRDRINDAEAKVLITQDEGWRAGKVVPLKQNADDAVADTPSIEKVVVLRRTGNDVPWTTTATSGGTTWSRASRPTARRRRWTPRTSSTCSTPRGPRPSPRGSCTPPAAT